MEQDFRIQIAKRAAMELQEGWVVNLGIGIPIMVADYVDQAKNIYFQSDNGLLGMGCVSPEDRIDPYVCNALGMYCDMVEGGSFFDSVASFAMIRGGHLDAVIMGSMQVSQNGDFANWMLPGKDMLGMGGALDLAAGVKKIIITMQHVSAQGEAKILPQCTLPLTAPGAVDTLITEYAVFYFRGGSMTLKEISPAISLDDLKRITPAEYAISPDLRSMTV